MPTCRKLSSIAPWLVTRRHWASALGCYGIQRIHLLRDLVVLAGGGVGGGSLNYANTLYRPPDVFFRDPQWAHLADWRAELDARYGQAERMPGVSTYIGRTAADDVLQRVARDMGVAGSARSAAVAAYTPPDHLPYSASTLKLVSKPPSLKYSQAARRLRDLGAHQTALPRHTVSSYVGGQIGKQMPCLGEEWWR